MSKYLANITINKSQRKITIGIYERIQKNNDFDDKLVNTVQYQCKTNKKFKEKLEDVKLEYINYDQQIHHEN
ncbi:MAG: hypothetical protein WCW16_05560 [Candidatus Magasanikbacteria bacterium]